MKVSMTARISAVVVLLAAVAFWVNVGLGVYSNGYQSFKARYVAYNGQAIKDGDTLELEGAECEFRCTGAGFKFVSWGDYGIKITVNPGIGAAYTADGTDVSLDGADVTEYFGIERVGQRFTIDNISVRELAERISSGAAVNEYAQDKPQYIMTVTDGNGGGKSYEYKLFASEPLSIEIDPDRVVAW